MAEAGWPTQKAGSASATLRERGWTKKIINRIPSSAMRPDIHQFHGPCDAIAAAKDHRRLSLRCCAPSRSARIPMISQPLRRRLLAWGIATDYPLWTTRPGRKVYRLFPVAQLACNFNSRADHKKHRDTGASQRRPASRRRPLCFETCL